jgi:hypothetical protein
VDNKLPVPGHTRGVSCSACPSGPHPQHIRVRHQNKVLRTGANNGPACWYPMMIGAGAMRRRGSTGRLRREPLPPFLSWLVGGPRRFLLGLIILWLLYNFVTVLTGISRTRATTSSPLRIHAVTSREAPPARFPPLSPPPPAEPTGPPTFPEGGPTTGTVHTPLSPKPRLVSAVFTTLII